MKVPSPPFPDVAKSNYDKNRGKVAPSRAQKINFVIETKKVF